MGQKRQGKYRPRHKAEVQDKPRFGSKERFAAYMSANPAYFQYVFKKTATAENIESAYQEMKRYE